MPERREFFRALLRPVRGEEKREEEELLRVRPPYVRDGSTFQSLCQQCESKACASACEESIIVIAADGSPLLNFTKSGCTFCEACAEACEAEVLDLTEGRERINARFVIDPAACVSHHGTICFACKEPCIDDAILFAGMFNPVIDDDRCTGCGFCLARCPTSAIRYTATAIEGIGTLPREE
ncbi:4Fe-4S binding protein [Nitratifractor sp.]